MTTKTFRTSLTPEMVLTILSLARTAQASAPSTAQKDVIDRLAGYEFKIRHELIAPAYTTNPKDPKQSLLASLGGGEPEDSSPPVNYALRREAAYTAYLAADSSYDSLSPQEIEDTQIYMEDKGLLSPEEAQTEEDSTDEAERKMLEDAYSKIPSKNPPPSGDTSL